MPRTLPAGLSALMAGNSFSPYFRIGFSEVTDPLSEFTEDIFSFKLHPLEFEATFYAADPTFIVSGLERGALIGGVQTGIITSKMYVTEYETRNRIHTIKAHVFDKTPVSFLADISYQDVIETICAEFNKTAAFFKPTAAWLAYQFFPDGKSLILNDARKFFNLLRQKYAIFATDNGDEELLFFHYRDTPHSSDHTIIDRLFLNGGPNSNSYFISRDENGTLVTSGNSINPLHNLGFLPSTASHPAVT